MAVGRQAFKETSIMTAQPTITLFAFGPGFGLPEISPYCTKAEVQLQMAGLSYRKAKATREDSPKGQLPFIEDGGVLIADTTFIRAHIERKYGFDFDQGLDATKCAQAWAVERMLENQLGFAMGYFRWVDPENFAKGPAHFFDHVPEAARGKVLQDVQTQVAANMKAVGIARHAPDEIVWLGEKSLTALSVLLGARPYLFGDQPCGTDATAFGILAAILTPFFDSPLRRQAETYANLVAYTDRMMATYFPSHPWTQAAAA
jgi:glutathione S-transferase